MNFFGTDGIRGTYGSTLTDGTAFLLGKSLALSGECPIVVIARDTRISGDNLFGALAAGVYEGGGNVINLGILPTNAVGHFVRKLGGDYGVMITASHNPPTDNGLKVFDKYGVKLCSSKQKSLTRLMSSLSAPTNVVQRLFEPVFYDIDCIYCEDLLRQLDVDLRGISVALDCCYGAAHKVAPMLLEMCGATVVAYCNQKDGNRINVHCGATNASFLQGKMAQNGCNLGFSFDGDADRLAILENQTVVPSSNVFYAFAKYLHQRGKLCGNAVVGTVLTNGGVEKALNNLGISLVRSAVGDTNVFNAMVKHGLNFGGEESGHYLLCDYATSSDALVNALFAAKIFKEMGSILAYTAELAEAPFAQTSIAITDKNKALTTENNLQLTANRVQKLFPHCRVVLRKSGTENKVRAYLEGEDAHQALQCVAATFAQDTSPLPQK